MNGKTYAGPEMVSSGEKIYGGTGNTAISHIPETSGIRVLDIGCGSGAAGRFIKSRQEAVVVGITISQTERDLAQEVLDDCVVFDIENGLPHIFKEKFDFVLMSHVLEHIRYPEALLRDVKQVLAPKGRVIVVIPNIMHYSSRLKLMAGIFEYSDTGMYDYTHVRWYTYVSAERLFTKNGFFTLLRDVNVCLPFGRLMNRIPSALVKQRISSILKAISRGLFGHELVYVFSSVE